MSCKVGSLTMKRICVERFAALLVLVALNLTIGEALIQNSASGGDAHHWTVAAVDRPVDEHCNQDDEEQGSSDHDERAVHRQVKEEDASGPCSGMSARG